jgi:hypothetical protein
VSRPHRRILVVRSASINRDLHFRFRVKLPRNQRLSKREFEVQDASQAQQRLALAAKCWRPMFASGAPQSPQNFFSPGFCEPQFEQRTVFVRNKPSASSVSASAKKRRLRIIVSRNVVYTTPSALLAPVVFHRTGFELGGQQFFRALKIPILTTTITVALRVFDNHLYRLGESTFVDKSHIDAIGFCASRRPLAIVQDSGWRKRVILGACSCR